MDTKEIVALTEKWLERISEITVNYEKAAEALEKARQDYKSQTKKWYSYVMPYLSPILVIILLLIAFGITLRFSSCPNPISIKFQELELTQHCNQK
jgi:hypothetical protein